MAQPQSNNANATRLKHPTLPPKPLAAIQPGQTRNLSDSKPKGSNPHPANKNQSTTNGVYFSDLHWWTSDVDIAAALSTIGAPVETHHVAFSEHKVNGKSKGMAYVELESYDSARLVKRWFDANHFQQKMINVTIASGGTSSNPFRTLPKEPYKENHSKQHGNSRAPHHKAQHSVASDHKYKNYVSPQQNQSQPPPSTNIYPFQQPSYVDNFNGSTNDFANPGIGGTLAGDFLPHLHQQQYQSMYPYGQQMEMQGGFGGVEAGDVGGFGDAGFGGGKESKKSRYDL